MCDWRWRNQHHYDNAADALYDAAGSYDPDPEGDRDEHVHLFLDALMWLLHGVERDGTSIAEMIEAMAGQMQWAESSPELERQAEFLLRLLRGKRH